MSTKQMYNALEQLRSVVEKRWFEIAYSATNDNMTISFNMDKKKVKKYYKDKEKKIEAFRERRSKYFDSLPKKKKIKLVRHKS